MEMNGLIGYTGFVGQNLDGPQYEFRFNSKNSGELAGKSFDLLVCAGVPGHKTLANQFPEQDWQTISELMEHLSQVQCQKLVLISTIDVIPDGAERDEDVELWEDGMFPYALHRIKMERFVRHRFPDATIVRLPGIFGKGLRKNFIFDLIFKIPRMFSDQEFLELKVHTTAAESKLLDSCYQVGRNGLWSLVAGLEGDSIARLRQLLEEHQCTSLRFTDSRSQYAYYDLSCLKEDLQKIIQYNIPLIHLATEPISAAELAEKAFHIQFSNEIPGKIPAISYAKSKYASLWNGNNGYLYSKSQVIEQLRSFDVSSIRLS